MIFFSLRSTTWLLSSKLMKSPCVPAGIISKCTTVDCEDYAFISGGRDGDQKGSGKMRLFGVNNSPSLYGVLFQECRGCRWDLVELKDLENQSCLPALGYKVIGLLKYINGIHMEMKK